jgi:predicted Zn finger-like uncharacterized protein
MADSSRTVVCPNCSTRYLLPETLIGPAGARVKCPSCAGTFVVSNAAPVGTETLDAPEPVVVLSERPAASAAGPGAGDASDQHGVARELVDGFASGREAEIEAAARDGKLFAQFGDELMRLFDEYRKRVGRGADPAPFRDVVRERLGLDLTPPGDA